MALVFDRRIELAGRPGLHAFIVGISHYPHLLDGGGIQSQSAFGMTTLQSPALTGYRIYQWLVARKDHLALPLATVHLLLSLSPEEETALGPERASDYRTKTPTQENFAAEAAQWRECARVSDDDMTLFYFAGHGLARQTDDCVLLCQDYGRQAAALNGAFDLDDLQAGMKRPHALPQPTAKRQVYFVDACKTTPTDFRIFNSGSIPGIWGDVELDAPDDRSRPVFYATASGQPAMARKLDLTFFGEALIACLKLDAVRALRGATTTGRPRYGVTVFALGTQLPIYMAALAAKFNFKQQCTLEGKVVDLDLHYLDAPPQVDVAVKVVPDAAAPRVHLEVVDAGQNAFITSRPVQPNPFEKSLPAGIYWFRVHVDPADAQWQDVESFEPVEAPRQPITLVVSR